MLDILNQTNLTPLSPPYNRLRPKERQCISEEKQNKWKSLKDIYWEVERFCIKRQQEVLIFRGVGKLGGTATAKSSWSQEEKVFFGAYVIC